MHIKQTITWSHDNECIAYVNWTILHLKHDSEFLEGRGACVRPILHNWHFNQTCVIIRIGSIGIIIHDTVISSLPNWSVCFVLRRTGFLLIYVIIYIIGICGYTKRSLIKSRFIWCIIYTTFISILSKLVTISFFFYFWITQEILCYWNCDVMNDVICTCLIYHTKAHDIALRMTYNT